MEKKYIKKINRLETMLKSCYSKDTCYPKYKEKWNINNPTCGQCAITALILNDYFGGKLGKVYIGNISHYFNIINGKPVDFTSSQFKHEVDYSNYQLVNRNIMLQNKNTRSRYYTLKRQLEKLL